MKKKLLFNWERKGNIFSTINNLYKKGGFNLSYYIYRYRFNSCPDRKFNVIKFPIDLIVEVASSCNLNCDMCFQASLRKNNPKTLTVMDFDLYKKIIDESAKEGVCSVKVSWRGEPMLNKNYIEMIKYAKLKGIIEVTSLTNATLLTEEMSTKILDSGLDNLIISIDGATKETYEKVRKGANFDTVIGNIERFLKVRGNRKKPFVRLQYTESHLNNHETDDFYKQWIGKVDEISISYEMSYGFLKNGFNALEENTFEFFCKDLWYRLAIMADGSVSPCCVDVGSLMDLGNLRQKSIKEIWHSKKLNEFRKLHKEFKYHEISMCRECVRIVDQSNKKAGRSY